MSDDVSAFPVVDQETITDLQDVMPAKLPELIAVFLRQLPGQLGDIAAAVARGDADTVYRAAHKLKSGSASIGALQLAESARRLEAAGRGGKLAACAPLLEQLEQVAARTQDSYQALLSP